MIGFFRRIMSSWVVLGLLGLVLIAFIVTGVGDPFGGMGGGSGGKLATVGRTAITETQISQQMDRAVRAARQQDPQVDQATYVRAGGLDQLLSQSIVAEAIKQWAEKQGFAVSRRQVDGEIASIPAFQIAGKFDQSTYESALSQQKLSDRELRDGLKGDLVRKQVLLPVSAGTIAPEGIVKPYAELLLEERTGTIGIVPSALLADKQPPSDADIQKFYAKNKARFMTPERRVIRYALITPESLPPVTPSDADIQKFYAANQATYGASEKRKLSQVILPDEAGAKAFVERARKGESFDKLAAEKGFGTSDTAIGEQNRTEFSAATSPAIAAAAFAAARGAVSDPVKSDYGWHIVRVDAIAATPARSLDSVRAEIAGKLTVQKKDEALADLVAKIEDGLGNGQGLADVLKANRLVEATTPPIRADGSAPDNPDFKLPPELHAVLKQAFSLAPDDDPVVEEAGKDHYVALAVGDVIEAAPVPLANIKAQVAAGLAQERAAGKAKALADTIVASVKKGMPFAKALADAKMPPPQTTTNRRIDVASRGEQVPPPLALLFTLPANGVRALAAPGGQGWFIVKVDQVKKGDISTAPAILESTRAQFNQFMGDEYVAQFARAVGTEVGIKRNEKAIQRMKAQLLRGASDDQ